MGHIDSHRDTDRHTLGQIQTYTDSLEWREDQSLGSIPEKEEERSKEMGRWEEGEKRREGETWGEEEGTEGLSGISADSCQKQEPHTGTDFSALCEHLEWPV